jgi:hypothetical protein
MTKAPRVIKLTAAFIYDDKKLKGQDLTVAYIVEAFVRDVKASLDTKQVKVVAGRIISDIFNSDLHATKNIDKDLGASYNVSYGGSRASLLTNLMTTRSAYTLVVEFENNSSLTVNVKPTPESSGPSEKWMSCGSNGQHAFSLNTLIEAVSDAVLAPISVKKHQWNALR